MLSVAVQPEAPEIKLKLVDVIPKKVEVVQIEKAPNVPTPEPAKRKLSNFSTPEIRKRYYPFGASAPVLKRMR